MTQEQRNRFLIEEFENLMSDINCPDEYIMDLFISDIMREDCVVEKFSYRRSTNFLLIYRGLLFLLERRFEIFLNVTLFREIIRNVGIHNPSEAVVICLIRAGIVFAITDIWKDFIEKKRDLRGNIETSMEESKQKFQLKQKLPKKKL